MEMLHAYLGLMLCVAAMLCGAREFNEGPHGAPGAERVARTSVVPRTEARLREAA